jgi:replicative superfamily II helicase
VGYHTGALTAGARDIIERAFKRGDGTLTTLIATSTLATGNLPAEHNNSGHHEITTTQV